MRRQGEERDAMREAVNQIDINAGGVIPTIDPEDLGFENFNMEVEVALRIERQANNGDPGMNESEREKDGDGVGERVGEIVRDGGEVDEMRGRERREWQ